MAFKLLNFAQKEDNPEAYEPDFVVQHRKKQEQMAMDQQQAEQYKKDPLFDFDD